MCCHYLLQKIFLTWGWSPAFAGGFFYHCATWGPSMLGTSPNSSSMSWLTCFELFLCARPYSRHLTYFYLIKSLYDSSIRLVYCPHFWRKILRHRELTWPADTQKCGIQSWVGLWITRVQATMIAFGVSKYFRCSASRYMDELHFP